MNKTNEFTTITFQSIIILLVFASFVVTISCNPKQQKQNNSAVKNDLMDILLVDSTILLDLKYATKDNFLGKPVYSVKKCYLLKLTAKMLSSANKHCKTLGLRIKIFDGYRPHSVQKQMWELVPNPMYVADPANGSHHNRGCAVDVTLVNSLGNELLMPTDFDDFTEKAHHDYMNLPEEAIKNRELLKRIMIDAGFVPLNSEWWHYSIPECGEYEILDMPL